MAKFVDHMNKLTAEIEAENARIEAGGEPRKASPAGLVMLGLLGFVIVGFLVLALLPSAPVPPKTAAQIEREAFVNKLLSASTQCMAAVRDRSKYPSEADIDPDMLDLMARLEMTALDAETFTYTGRAYLMNDFGAMIPHRYRCVIDIPGWAFVETVVEPG
jgi:ABC-type microcin C transport system permease subunit YejB